MKHGENETLDWRSRVRRWVFILLAGIALEGIFWGAVKQLGVKNEAEILVLGSIAFLSTASVFAPDPWLRHPDIAGSAADYPWLVRIICAVGGGLLWVLVYVKADR